MSKLKLAGPALLFVVFLLPSFAQDAPASMFAKQVEHDIAALSFQLSVGAWQELHPDEKLELMHYNHGKDHYEADLGMEFYSWCAASPSQSPSTFGRVALFFVPSVKAGALPPLPRPGRASIKESCRMQALHYSVSPEIPIQDLVRELSSAWGAPSGSLSGPRDISLHSTAWDHEGVSVRLEFRLDYGPHGRPDAPVGIVLYAKRDALPAVTCFECTHSYPFPLFSEKLTLLMQEAAQIAAEDPALTRQIVSQSGPIEGVRSAEDPSLAVIRLRKWLEVPKQRSPQQRAAALLLADLYVENAQLGYATKPYVEPAEFYKGLGAEYDKGGNYVHNLLDQAEKMDDGGEVSELAGLWALSDECSYRDERSWPDVAIEKAESFLAHFPPDQWTPYVHYALARAHSAKLAWSYPGGDAESVDNNYIAYPLPSAARDHERDAAVEHFRAFLDAKPEGPEVAFAWLEVWRLIAGLPPSSIGWGCGGE
jgi:hypothetical protein